MPDDTTYAPPGTSALHLQTLSEQGTAPESRVRDAFHARSDVTHLIEANAERFRRWAMIKGMFQGNPPYNPQKLRSSGQGWRFNIATLEGKGLLSAACAPYYDLFSSGQYYAEIATAEGTPDEQAEWSAIITEEWDAMVKAWSSFDFRIQRLIGDFVGYGRGFLTWASPLDWRFRYVSHDAVLIPDCTEVDDEELKLFVIRRKVHVTDLWKTVRDKAASEAAGWNRRAVIDAIRAAVPVEPTATHYDYNAVQDQINDADIYTYARDAYVSLAHYYVQEFTGKWSHFVVVEEEQPYTSRQRDGKPQEAQFLYRAVGRYSSLYEIMCPFVFEIHDNTWNGVAGLGKDIFGVMQAKDRLRNSQLDNMLMRQSLLLQATKASDRQKLAIFQVGPTTIIPENCTPVESRFVGDIESSIAVNIDLNNMLQMNLGIYRPQLQKPQGNPRTATEASLDFQQSTILGSAAVNRFYRQLDQLYAQMYKRTVDNRFGEEARDFIARCKERGVPERALRNTKLVRASRSIGNGSPFLRQQALAMLAQVAPSFPEAGRIAWIRDFVSAVANRSAADRYVPLPETPKRSDDHVAWAMIENSALNDPAPVKRTATQNDILHAQTHIEAMSGALASLEQGADPASVLRFLESAGAHAMAHILAVKGDKLRQGDVDALEGTLKQFAAAADKLRAHVEQQAKEGAQNAQAQQALPVELQIELARMQAEIALKQQQQDAQLKLAKEKQDAELRLKEQETLHSMRLEEIKVRQDLVLKDAETAADIANQSRKTESDIENANRKTE